MNKITPFLWYNDNCKEAADFYLDVFKEGKMLSTMPGPGGNLMGCTIEINGQVLTLFNGGDGGPMYKFTHAFSLFIDCTTQEEVDYYWDKFIGHGGKESRCGWLQDKYGLSWQVVPKALMKYMSDPDRGKANKVIEAMMGMSKLIIKELDEAYAS